MKAADADMGKCKSRKSMRVCAGLTYSDAGIPAIDAGVRVFRCMNNSRSGCVHKYKR